MERYRIAADVLHQDEPAEVEFTGEHARVRAVAFMGGLVAAGPNVLQVAVYRAVEGGWRWLGTRVNDIYVGGYPAAQDQDQ